jgi:hypothetical protein
MWGQGYVHRPAKVHQADEDPQRCGSQLIATLMIMHRHGDLFGQRMNTLVSIGCTNDSSSNHDVRSTNYIVTY